MLSKKQMKNPFARKSLNDPSSVQLPDINERFVDACENGDLNTVNNIIQHIKDFNIEITDNLGRTALRLAVENEHLEVVQALLARSDSQKIRDALLLAIFMGHTTIAEAILKHPKYKIFNEKKFLNGDTDSFWQTPSSDDAQFSPDITPIMLASQYNRTEIVQMLLLNGDRISKPHDFNCKCTECLNKFKFDSLRHAQSRLNAYKGLASESYISLASIDPILTAFELGHEFGILANKEKYFKHEYLQLRHSLSTYSVKLLNNVRGRDELDIVLNKTGKEKEEKYEQLARLDLALRFQEKPFVAHSNCQQKLDEIWYSGIRKISKMNPIIIFFLILLHILILPISSLIYAIAPKSKIGKFMRQSCVKFISHVTSYVIFLIMVLMSTFMNNARDENEVVDSFLTQYQKYNSTFAHYYTRDDLHIRVDFSDFYVRQHSPYTLDIAVSVWIIGQSWHEIKQLFKCGIYEYLYSATNLVNLVMNVLYIASYGLKYWTMITVTNNLNVVVTDEFWHKVGNLSVTDNSTQFEVYQTFYWLNSDRFYWLDIDPINISEGLFAIGNLISFARLCFYLPAYQHLGPLQITLGKMINDILKFIFIFSIVFISFVFGLNNLYWYYSSEVRGHVEITRHCSLLECKESEITNAEEAFGSIGKSIMTLFFALYTIGDSTDTLISPFDNNLTVITGYILFGTFHVANITIMINMLIAMMTKSFEDIIHHSDIEWKFARSKLYMEYIKEDFTLPVPLNLLPTPISTYYSIRKYFKNLNENRKLKTQKSFSTNPMDDQPSVYEMKSQISAPNGGLQRNDTKKNDYEKQVNLDSFCPESSKLTYRIVMERVVKRYLMHNQGDSDDPKQNEVDELKQDLQTMRYELLNDLKKSREDNVRNMLTVNGCIQFVAEELLNYNYQTVPQGNSNVLIKDEKDNTSSQSYLKYKELLNAHQNLLRSSSSLSLIEHHDISSTANDKNDNSLNSSMINNDFYKKKNPTDTLNDVIIPEKNVDSTITSVSNISEIAKTSAEPNNKLQPNIITKSLSTDDFYQNRLAYDFQTIYEDD